jgi:hypothetical protein
MKKVYFYLTILFFVSSVSCGNAEMQPYSLSDIYELYPAKDYLIGIGETTKTDNRVKDRRAAEILARLDIAEQIMVKVEAETVD